MDLERKIELVKRKPTEEVISDGDLRELFQTNNSPQHYIGFEISGKVHLGSGLMTALKIRDFLDAGIKPTIFLADFHTWINNKLGGDLQKIREVALGYFKHAFLSLGLEEGKVRYVFASDLYDAEYWKTVIKISKATSIQRMIRCMTIMGRKETEATEAASLLYPALQSADIFMLKADIAHAGMDQRKVHILAREVAEKFKRKKPVAVHSHLLPGLLQAKRMGFEQNERLDMEISGKMSKSIPDSAIYIHDSEEDIKRKIGNAFCPPKIVEGNPIIEYSEYLILRDPKARLRVERPTKFGGDVEFASAEELKKDFAEGKLHPQDLKNAVTRELASMLKPSRDYFAKRPELIRQIEGAEVTR